MPQELVGSDHTLFYDTYALYAIALGQESYFPFASKHRILTSLMNLYELYYTLLKEGQLVLAEELFSRLLSACVYITPEMVKQAATFRYKFKKKKFSYVDCLGYTVAQQLRVPFLTGDAAFFGLSNVKFVK